MVVAASRSMSNNDVATNVGNTRSYFQTNWIKLGFPKVSNGKIGGVAPNHPSHQTIVA